VGKGVKWATRAGEINLTDQWSGGSGDSGDPGELGESGVDQEFQVRKVGKKVKKSRLLRLAKWDGVFKCMGRLARRVRWG
jgi:hypothetical protein